MPKYQAVDPNIWNPRFRITDSETKVVFFHLWTNSARRTAGLYSMPLGHVAYDTGLSEETVRAKLKELEGLGLIRYDLENEIVLLNGALKTQPPVGKQIVGAVRLATQLPETPLLRAFLDLAETHAPVFAEELRQALYPPAALHQSPIEAPSEGRVELGSKRRVENENERGSGSGSAPGSDRGSVGAQDACEHGFVPANWCRDCAAVGS